MFIERIFKLLFFCLTSFGIGIYAGKDLLNHTELRIFINHISLFIVGVLYHMISNGSKVLRVFTDEISLINGKSVGRIEWILLFEDFLSIAFDFWIGFKQVSKGLTKFKWSKVCETIQSHIIFTV